MGFFNSNEQVSMKRLALICFLTVFAASAVFGQGSRGARGDSFIFFGYTPVGLHLATLFSQPLSFGVILGESLEIGVEVGSWEGTDNDEDVDLKGEFSNMGVFMRYFPGNSFYISLSAHKREWTLTANSTVTSGASYTGTVDTTATVVGLGIGNQWMFDFGMYIGVDWVMLSGAASSDKTVTVSGLTGADLIEAEQELSDAGDTLNKWSGLSGVTILTVGWAF